MHLLITGNTGFIGPVMTRMAKERGHKVTGLDVGYFKDCIVDPAMDCPPDHQILRDIREVKAEDLKGIDAIIHLAGLSNDPLGALNPQLTYDINLDSTVRLGQLAKDNGVQRFVFASSCSIYGAAHGSDAALDESAPFNPVSAYAVSKVRSEEGLSPLADKDFCPVFMRNATAYGVSARTRMDLVVNNLAGWAYTAGVIKVMSDGTPWRPLVHIEDISLAALCAAEAPTDVVHNQAFNIGRNDANYQVMDIANAVHKRFPDAKLEITGETGGDARSYRVNFDKALGGLPGFAPKWTVEMGADEVANWLRSNGLRDQAFDGRLFIRLKQLKHQMEQGLLDGDLRVVRGRSL
ncbi:MAG: SDR family oxidoreductase [Hyphomonadaceae bacterium]|nr:SDR family oxidoreductase [Hyphomonadaceae bacterium]